MNPHLKTANMWQPWQPWTLSSPGFWTNMREWSYWWVFSFAAGGHSFPVSQMVQQREGNGLRQIQFWHRYFEGMVLTLHRSSSKQQSNLESEASCLVASTHTQLNHNFPWHHNLLMGCTTWTVFKPPCRPFRLVSWERVSPVQVLCDFRWYWVVYVVCHPN